MAGTENLEPVSPEKVDTRAQSDDKPTLAKFWHNEIAAAAKRDEPWIKRARKVVQRFRDERDDHGTAQERRANILWSNTELLKAALFQSIGAPDVRQRFPKRGYDEKVTRTAALVQERAIAYGNDAYDCDSQVECAVEDMVLPGRGVCWVVYDADVNEDAKEGEPAIRNQIVREEHIYWEDFRHSAGRKWSDIWWVARRHSYSRDELKEYFAEHADKIPLDAKLVGADERDEDDDTFKRAAVWEIWDKTKRQRVYVAEGYPFTLKTDDDPYRLQDFFPCPEPLFKVKTTSSMVAIPEFTLYQDQANELDVITTRLSLLIDALKRRGVYDSGLDGSDGSLGNLAYARDNEFIPFRGWAGLMEKGGLKAAFQTEDLAPIIQVVQGLYQQRQLLIQTIYEVTGISDVIRGASNPNETATAQRIKGQFGSMRLQKSQKRIVRFVRELTRMKAEILSEHFTRETLQEMTGIEMPLKMEQDQARMQLAMIQQQQAQAQQMAAMGNNGGPPMGGMPGPMPTPQPPPPVDPAVLKQMEDLIAKPSWEDVAAILRSDERRGFKIDVETDQSTAIDDQEEKAARTEFLSSMSAYFTQIMPAMIANPSLKPLVREMTMFAVKAFKAGRPLEQAFEDAFDQLDKQPPPPPQTDPVAEAKAAALKQQTEAAAAKSQADLQIQQQQAQADLGMKALDAQSKQLDLALKVQGAKADMAMRQQEMEAKTVNNLLSMADRRRQMMMDQQRKAMGQSGI